MSAIEELYPTPCAFCRISSAYPPECSGVPQSPDSERVDPQCHLILSAPLVLAFLDIMPISPGHILLTTRKHYRTLGDLPAPASKTNDTWVARRAAEEAHDTSRALGEWLPIISRALCKVTGIEDWNVVQNNGERAAQVVPHIHFHLIPRYQEGRQEARHSGRTDSALKSWKMFGRGSREDLDDDEARELANRLRDAIKTEVEIGSKTSKL